MERKRDEVLIREEPRHNLQRALGSSLDLVIVVFEVKLEKVDETVDGWLRWRLPVTTDTIF